VRGESSRLAGGRLRIVALLSAAVVLVACTQSSSSSQTSEAPPHDPVDRLARGPVIDLASFMQELQASGFAVREGGRPGLPLSLLDAPGKNVFMGGEAITTFEYPTRRALADARSDIRPRGDQIPTEGGTALINWTDAPLFFARGRLLVVYSGTDEGTLKALNRILGLPFAGGFY